MIAAVLTQPGKFELKNTTSPELKEGQLKIRVEGCGVCASSIPLWEGREWFQYPVMPGAPGHEGWGIVDEVAADVTSFRPGDRGAFLSGNSYAEFDIANEHAVVRIPDSQAGKPFPGEPLGCAMNIFERSDIQEGDVVAIIGIGFLGALLCQLAKARGAKVIAISRRKYSLGFAERYGADEIVPLTETWDVAAKVGEITSGAFCHRVIEATGKQEALDIATEIVAEGGKLIVAGYHQDGLRQINFQKWNWKGIDVINAHERDPRRYLHGMSKAVEAVVNGKINPESLYTNIFPLEKLADAFSFTVSRPDGFMKALVQI